MPAETVTVLYDKSINRFKTLYLDGRRLLFVAGSDIIYLRASGPFPEKLLTLEFPICSGCWKVIDSRNGKRDLGLNAQALLLSYRSQDESGGLQKSASITT